MFNIKKNGSDLQNQKDHRLSLLKEGKKEGYDTKRFQGIADQRYQESLSNLHTELNTPKYNAKAMHENALKEKKQLDMEKDTIFLKKWE